MTPTPPPGMRILSDEELTKPLPMDAMCCFYDDGEGANWEPSALRGEVIIEKSLIQTFWYATAKPPITDPPPTDWRKLCEELVTLIEHGEYHRPSCASCITPLGVCNCDSGEILTRAKTALEQEDK